MRKAGWVAVAVLALALTSASGLVLAGAEQEASQGAAGAPVQIAQGPPSGGTRGDGRRGEMSEADREKMRQQMIERMLEQAGLTAAEKTAARNALKVKDQARKALQDALTNLRRTANKENPTNKELGDALVAYRTAFAQYTKKVHDADVALTKQLSVKSQVRCISLGILDNGLGMMGMMGGGRGGAVPSGAGARGFRPSAR